MMDPAATRGGAGSPASYCFQRKSSIIKVLLTRHCDDRQAPMKRSPLSFNPELRASAWHTARGLPFLAYRSLRWRALRGGWLPGHIRTHRPFDRRAIPEGVPIDILVMVADHYEPARRDGDAAAVESVR